MAFSLKPNELENEIISLLKTGVAGNSKDFFSWVRMEIQRKFKDDPDCSEDAILKVLENFLSTGDLNTARFDSREFQLSEKSKFHPKMGTQDQFLILGRLEFSPMQYVKTRLEYFLRRNKIAEEEIVDISIATVEAVENSVKYGDGGEVAISYRVDSSKTFHISLVNNIKDFDLEEDIKRGKFSSTATLMRGMMVMQKLFTRVDLEILEDRKQAKLTAHRVLNS
jgi:anti-sigma regulatory factor (Ser/Thr protein kinase)